MFYCDPCAKKKKWPVGMVRSHGRCEVCGRTKDCSDTPSTLLPFNGAVKLVVPRKEVMVFARAMEVVLRQNDWKPGWKGDLPTNLMDRIWDEMRELEVKWANRINNTSSVEDVQKELVDVANFCMMTWERLEARSMRAEAK